MLLVIGGRYSGKRTYVRSRGYGEADMGTDPAGPEPVLLWPEDRVRGHAPSDSELAQMLAKEVVVTCEVGAGVVPMDAGERVWRERAGRLQARLAEQADTVVRLVCGIPQVLKGEMS